ncbi:hypothetical protein BH23CHL5_BH23CHL5_01250 [soil metagenome]
MDRIESFLDGIPGYSGYREKESRRDSDRRVREAIANQLEGISQRVERGGAAIVRTGDLSRASEAEGLVRDLKHAANRIRSQRYGYGGVFSDTPVDQRVLSQLFMFDKSLAARVEQLDADLSSIENDMTNTPPDDTTIPLARASVRSILDQLETRDSVVETAAPASARSLFTALSGEPEAADSSAAPIEIGIGEAIAHFDDDYIVDALIEYKDPANRVRFLRLDQPAGKWLVIAEHGPRELSIVTDHSRSSGEEASSSNNAASESVAWTVSGRAKITEIGKKPSDGDATIVAYHHSADPTLVSFRVLSGADARYYSGYLIHSDDVSVFGKPKSR